MTRPDVLRAELATAADRAAVLDLRHCVFVVEQGVPGELEQDEHDGAAVHALVRGVGGRVVGTGRLVVEPGGHARIGRMAVAGDARRRGVGTALLQVLEAAAADAGCHQVTLHAQVHAVGFYRRAGYEQEQGEPFDDAGILHVAMSKSLS